MRLGPPEVGDPETLIAVLRQVDRALDPGSWIRAVGYHESVFGELDRWALDRVLPNRPVRVQHRSGALWILNSRAAALVSLDDCDLPGVERDDAGQPTGRLWRLDSWLAERLPRRSVSLSAISARALRMGIVGFTDATPELPDESISDLAEAVRRGEISQRLVCMAPAKARDPEVARFTLGPIKIILDDETLPGIYDFAADITAAHAAGRPVAVHCVTRTQLALTQSALDIAGIAPGDRIEHAAIVPEESIPWLREHGVQVVTQPHFVTERGAQYRRDVPAYEHSDLWRLRSLLDGGVAVAAGTDAPFGNTDPWAAIRAAVHRPSWLPVNDCVPAGRALALFLGKPMAPGVPRTIAPGHAADMTLLRVPRAEALRNPTAELVAATWVDGELAYLTSRY
ncbi:MAG: putative amidohydrolase [Nocardia sp.]|nr:putative amidohydrolase [Nocardia sp.]